MNELKKKPRKVQFSVTLIERLLEPKTKFLDKGFWPREIVFANRLLKKYPNQDFWLNAHFKPMKTLIYLLSSEALDLDKQYRMFNFNPVAKTDEIQIGEKVGEDYNKQKQVRTVKEFLT